MTIIQPSKNKNIISPIALLIIIFFMAGFYIYEYNQMVGLNYQMKSLKEAIIDYQSQNSDLKSQYYQLTNPAVLEKIAKENGLILEQQPQYLGINF